MTFCLLIGKISLFTFSFNYYCIRTDIPFCFIYSIYYLLFPFCVFYLFALKILNFLLLVQRYLFCFWYYGGCPLLKNLQRRPSHHGDRDKPLPSCPIWIPVLRIQEHNKWLFLVIEILGNLLLGRSTSNRFRYLGVGGMLHNGDGMRQQSWGQLTNGSWKGLIMTVSGHLWPLKRLLMESGDGAVGRRKRTLTT